MVRMLKVIRSRSPNGLTYVSVQLVAKLLGVVNLVGFAAVAASSAALGEFALWTLVSAVGTTLLDFGCSAATLRSAATSARGDGFPLRARRHLLALEGGAAIALLVASPLVGGLEAAVVITGLSAATAGNAIIESYLLGSERFMLASLPNVSFNLSVSFALLFHWRSNPELLGIDCLKTYTFGAVIGAIVGRIVLTTLRRHKGQGGPYDIVLARRSTVATGSLLFATQIDGAVIAALSNASTLGVYSFASRVANASASIPQLFLSSQQPRLARWLASADPRPPARQLLLQLVSVTSLLCFLTSCAFLVSPLQLEGSLPGLGSVLPMMLAFLPSFGFQALALASCRLADGKALSAAAAGKWLSLIGLAVACGSAGGYGLGGVQGLLLARLIIDILGYSALLSRVLGRIGPGRIVLSRHAALSIIAGGAVCYLRPTFSTSALTSAAIASVCLISLARIPKRVSN
jgi:hypothetical protein